MEGLASTLIKTIRKGMMSSTRSKLGGLLVKPALKETLKAFDASQYGGAPLLGLKGLVVKIHGNAGARETRNAIFQCVSFKEQDVNGKIKERFAQTRGAEREERRREREAAKKGSE